MVLMRVLTLLQVSSDVAPDWYQHDDQEVQTSYMVSTDTMVVVGERRHMEEAHYYSSGMNIPAP